MGNRLEIVHAIFNHPDSILCVIIQTLLFVAVVAKRNASRQAVAKMVQRDSILVYVTQCGVFLRI